MKSTALCKSRSYQVLSPRQSWRRLLPRRTRALLRHPQPWVAQCVFFLSCPLPQMMVSCQTLEAGMAGLVLLARAQLVSGPCNFLPASKRNARVLTEHRWSRRHEYTRERWCVRNGSFLFFWYVWLPYSTRTHHKRSVECPLHRNTRAVLQCYFARVSLQVDFPYIFYHQIHLFISSFVRYSLGFSHHHRPWHRLQTNSQGLRQPSAVSSSPDPLAFSSIPPDPYSPSSSA